MNEQEFGRRIGQWLDAGAARIEPATVSRLQIARKNSLSAADGGPLRRQVHAPATAGTGGSGLFAGPRLWLTAGILLLAAVGATYSYLEWRDHQAMLEAAELDAALLADDLPVKALIDSGFDSWLKHSVEPQ